MSLFPLGRREPTNLKHVENYPMRFAIPATIPEVESILLLPDWHPTHDQGVEGACVGHGGQMMMAIANTYQCLSQGAKDPYIRYNPFWLWNEAKKIDPWEDTNAGDNNGTLLSSACDVLREKGNCRWPDGGQEEAADFQADVSKYLLKDAGIEKVRWATSVDDIRSAVSLNNACAIGINWYSTFDKPETKETEYGIEYWIGKGELGYIRGGHCVCLYGASDQRQGFKLKNNWGYRYPEVWIPYSVMERLIRENGEIALITDK